MIDRRIVRNYYAVCLHLGHQWKRGWGRERQGKFFIVEWLKSCTIENSFQMYEANLVSFHFACSFTSYTVVIQASLCTLFFFFWWVNRTLFPDNGSFTYMEEGKMIPSSCFSSSKSQYPLYSYTPVKRMHYTMASPPAFWSSQSVSFCQTGVQKYLITTFHWDSILSEET